jgi:hypothetical protein
MEDPAQVNFDPSTAKPYIDPDAPALAEWIMRASPGTKAAYRETAAQRIVNAFKADDVAGVLQHAERVMPKAVRKGIKRAAMQAGSKSPGEFFAANAGTILSGRFTGRGSWRAQAKRWLADAADHVARTAGVRADAPILAKLSPILADSKGKAK